MKIFGKSAITANETRAQIKLLSDADIDAVAGGLNPQPLPPNFSHLNFSVFTKISAARFTFFNFR